MKKIGTFVGKYIPPHTGHISAIDYCLPLCDELRIVIADNSKDSKQKIKDAGLPPMSTRKRIKWFKEHYKNEPKVKILRLSEHGLKLPEDEKKWKERFYKVIGKDVNIKFSNEEYREFNARLFPELKFVAVPETIKIRATQIRENPEKYLKYVIPEGREYIKKHLDKKENKK